jgi:Protein of unknown function (DUF4232)
MSKRTLPDELRSVLLSHALQAPDPTDTVHRVLAATVAPDQPRAAGRRRWWASPLAAAAAVVLLAVLGGVGFVVDQQRHQDRPHVTANSGVGGANAVIPSRHPAEGQVAPPQLRPNIAPGEAGGVPPNPLPPTGLNCARLLPGSQLHIGSATKARLAGVNQDLYVYDFRCEEPDGTRSASTAVVYARIQGVVQQRAVLVSAGQGSKVDFVGSDAHTLVVQVLTRQQDLVRTDFTTRDGVHFSGDSALVAAACTPADLTARIARVDSASPTEGGQQPYAVQLTKHSEGICVLSGYPSVTAADGPPASAAPTLRGKSGGTGARVPEIVQLARGTTVAAMIEPVEQPACAPTDAVTVALPNGMSVGVLPASLALCGAQVHPIVPGDRGSD